MKVWKILESLESLESSMADFYGALCSQYAGDKAAAFFARLRDEELSHRDIVRYQRRVMFKAMENNIDLEGYDQQALDQAVRVVADLTARVAGLTLDEALRSALAFEADATEQHYRTVVGQASPSLGKLVRHLGCCDESHAARLSAFARAHAGTPSLAPA